MTTTGPSAELAHVAAGQIERITASEMLKGSESLCRILRYLGRQAGEQPGVAVKEYRIATEALGRSPDFDPKRDACVRVHIGRLRARLICYYAGPGADEAIIISIPRGAYRLSIRDRQSLPKPPASTPIAHVHPVRSGVFGLLTPVGILATICVLLGVLLGLALTHAGAAARSFIR